MGGLAWLNRSDHLSERLLLALNNHQTPTILRPRFQFLHEPQNAACCHPPSAVFSASTCKIRCRDWHPETPYWRHMTRLRLFLCVVRTATPQWRAERGRRKTRRFPVWPVMPTPLGSATREIGISSGGI